MKYWTGYLTAAILGGISWVLLQFGEKFTTLVDMVYPYVTRTVMDYLAVWSSPLEFCLWQTIVVAAAVVLIATIVLYILSPHITVYEVRQGSILKDNAYNGSF